MRQPDAVPAGGLTPRGAALLRFLLQDTEPPAPAERSPQPSRARRRPPRSPSLCALLNSLVEAEACLRLIASDPDTPGRQRYRAMRNADAAARAIRDAGGTPAIDRP